MLNLTLYYKSESGQIHLAHCPILFSCQIFIFPLFLQLVQLLPATSVYFPQLFRHVVSLFKHCLPHKFIYRHLNVPLFPSTRGSKWLIGYPIGRSDSARKRVSNRSSDWTVRLVTDPIDQSKNSVRCDSMRSSGRTKSPIGRINSSIEHMGLTLIRSDPSIGPTKSQPKETGNVFQSLKLNQAYGTHSDPIGSVLGLQSPSLNKLIYY